MIVTTYMPAGLTGAVASNGATIIGCGAAGYPRTDFGCRPYEWWRSRSFPSGLIAALRLAARQRARRPRNSWS